MTNAPDLIVADQVVKSYPVQRRSVEILHGISLGVSAGEMCAVMGPSGSGKSTLLYCLAGLERPTAGGVSVLGRPLHSLGSSALAKMRRTEVGFVFQSYNLVPTLTVLENVALPYRLDRMRPPWEQIRAALDRLGIAALADARPPSLSGGEQQRVALARVLSQQPTVVFADEPTGALDTTSGQIVLEELRLIAHDPHRCVLVVTHDPHVAARCDRVLFLRDGHLVRQLVQPSAADVAGVMTDLSEQVAQR